MSSASFVHLHLHSHYSILDGVCQIPPLLDRAKEMGFQSLALTDHGAMYGAMEFYSAAISAGIKPIVGMEAYVAPGSRFEKGGANGERTSPFHLTLLATNRTGYQNLLKLSTAGFLEGFYGKPRLDKELLQEHREGLIALSGCLSSEISRALLLEDLEGAKEVAEGYRTIFGEKNFFLEIQDNGLDEQKRILPLYRQLSDRTGIPLVATSDVHYIRPEDAKAQDVLLCLQTGKRLADENRMQMTSQEFYLKGAEQMRQLFKDFPDACDRTLEIAERCNLELELGAFHLPQIEPPEGLTASEYLASRVDEGLKDRYGEPLSEEVRTRRDQELEVINQMGFPSYFLMVADIVRFAKESGIPVGPGRGSAAGSIVAYALEITNIDPLPYGLLFERFLNIGRNEMPDIDLDFCKERRGEVVDYIIERFGREQCAQIVTFGCLSAKSGIRDVGRVMDVSLQEVDRAAKLVPDGLKPKDGKTTIDIALSQEPDLKKIWEEEPHLREVLDVAGTLDQVVRQTGKHAAGVLVADKAITEYCPLAKRGEDITTQYEMGILEKLGLCKVDVLGLETLTILKKAADNVRALRGTEIDLDAIELDDPAVYELLSEGRTKCVFQCESDGFTGLLMQLKPDRFEDLIAAVAMYRPGPLGAGLVDKYIACKHGRETPEYLHPMLEPILKETHGLILYQEQVQALAGEVAHFSLSEGDLMRRAMGKKKMEIMNEYREKFVKQATDTTGEEIAEKIFAQIEFFAGYGFNKSHSACYALIAYQTAWFKAHYPLEFMAAHMSCKMSNTDEIVACMNLLRKEGVEVLPPDINESRAEFTVVDDSLRFGLGAVKNVGVKAVESVVRERERAGPYRDLFDFCERVDLQTANRGMLEGLIRAGAFDSLGGHRAQYMAALDSAMAAGSRAAKARARNQTSLFGGAAEAEEEALHPSLPEVPAWPELEMLNGEKESLGFFVSSHPLAQHIDDLKTFATTTTQGLAEEREGASVILGGLVSAIKLGNTKKGDRYARLVMEDMEGTCSAVVWPRSLEACRQHLVEDAHLFVRGKVDPSQGQTPEIVVDEVIPMADALERLVQGVHVTLEQNGDDSHLDALEDLSRSHHGECPVFLSVMTPEGTRVYLRAGRRHAVTPSRSLKQEVDALLGAGHIEFVPRAV